jgi:hypothetical protein
VSRQISTEEIAMRPSSDLATMFAGLPDD